MTDVKTKKDFLKMAKGAGFSPDDSEKVYKRMREYSDDSDLKYMYNWESMEKFLMLRKEMTRRIGKNAFISALYLYMNNKSNGIPGARDIDYMGFVSESVDTLERLLKKDRKEIPDSASDIFGGLLILSEANYHYSSGHLIVPSPRIYVEKGMNYFRTFLQSMKDVGDYEVGEFAQEIPALMERKDGSFEYITKIIVDSKCERYYPSQLIKPYLEKKEELLKLGGEELISSVINNFFKISKSKKSSGGHASKYFKKSPALFKLIGKEAFENYSDSVVKASQSSCSLMSALIDFGPYHGEKINSLKLKNAAKTIFANISAVADTNWRFAGHLFAISEKIIAEKGIEEYNKFCKENAAISRAGGQKLSGSSWFWENQPYQ